MRVKFIGNPEPCITYEVLNEKSVVEYDEHLQKYCECIEISALGLIPKELLTEAAEHPNNLDAIDIAAYLTNNE